MRCVDPWLAAAAALYVANIMGWACWRCGVLLGPNFKLPDLKANP